MKAFIIALIVLLLTAGLCTANDIYCNSVCNEILRKTDMSNYEETKTALKLFEKNELLFRASCDAEYVSEAYISLGHLLSAYENGDEYEIIGYKKEATERIKTVKDALFI